MYSSRLVASRIIKASKQVVSGTLYRIHVNMDVSACKNVESNMNKGLESCDSKGPGPVCVFTIWSRPWMKKFGKDVMVSATHCQ